MIKISGLNKVYNVDGKDIYACKNIDLDIEKSSIHGIIGYSGAGKSTLVRCINLLERPSSGKVILEGVNLLDLDKKSLRDKRKEIGMIFQNFNLFSSRTVSENIGFSLKGYSKEEKEKKVKELLELVDLVDKKDTYPSQLSGGQKQRVAIARALANNPKVLLCDEATSALDPKTTKSILKLLKKLNKDLGLTIVIITHQMEVIKEICDTVSIMKNGEIVDRGKTIDLFIKSKKEETIEFLETRPFSEDLMKVIDNNKSLFLEDGNNILANITYIGNSVSKAVISEASRKFNINISILFGNIELVNDMPIGKLVICFNGERKDIKNAIKFFVDNGLDVEEIDYV